METETETEEVVEVEVFERDTKLNIHKRINAVMSECIYIKKEKVVKNKKGEVLFSVTAHDDVTGAIQPLLVKYGINLYSNFKTVTHEVLTVDYYGKDQQVNRDRVDVLFKWVNIDTPDDYYEQSWAAYGCDDGDKGIGKAASYALRQFILKNLHIPTGEKDLEDYVPPYETRKKEIIQGAANEEYEKSLKDFKEKNNTQDIPLPDGSQISDGTTISPELQMQVKKMFIKKRMGTEDQKLILDGFAADSIDHLLNSDYETVITLIKDA